MDSARNIEKTTSYIHQNSFKVPINFAVDNMSYYFSSFVLATKTDVIYRYM
jgi:hypothetical protein